MPLHPPFLIYALPRSRTAWLSKLLTYRDWICYHEKAFYLRQLSDIATVLHTPNTGSAETAAAPAWPLIKQIVPEHRAVVIRRPVEDTISAMMSVAALHGIFYDVPRLERVMHYGDRCLDKISQAPGTLTIAYDDLADESTVRRLFEFCLPYEFDRQWWLGLKDQNIQADVGAVFRYYFQHRQEIESFKSSLKRDLIRMVRSGELQYA